MVSMESDNIDFVINVFWVPPGCTGLVIAGITVDIAVGPAWEWYKTPLVSSLLATVISYALQFDKW